MQQFIGRLLVVITLAAACIAPTVYIHATFATAAEVKEVKAVQAALNDDVRDEIKEIRNDVKEILKHVR